MPILGIFETITKRLTEVWRSEEPAGRGHSYRCQCGRPVFFRNSLCLACKTPLGYEPDSQQIRALAPAAEPNTWKLFDQKEDTPSWRRCQNFDSPAGCNWLVSS